MPWNFPETPALNQYYVFNGIRWRWNGYAWVWGGVCGGSSELGRYMVLVGGSEGLGGRGQ